MHTKSSINQIKLDLQTLHNTALNLRRIIKAYVTKNVVYDGVEYTLHLRSPFLEITPSEISAMSSR